MYSHVYYTMSKTNLIKYFTSKVTSDMTRRKIDPSLVPIDYIVRVLLDKVAMGCADSTVNRECSKLLTLVSRPLL